MAKKKSRDIEKTYPKKHFITKLRRLVDALERNKSFSIQVHQERLLIPSDAVVNIEHERNGKKEELEFQIKWSLKK